MYMLWFALYGSANFFINSLAQHTMIHMGSDYKGLIINPLWVIQHSRYIIYTVNEYISGKLLLLGRLYMYIIHTRSILKDIHYLLLYRLQIKQASYK